jgi:hypothetical protein
MSAEFQREYAELNDDGLLHLATERQSLTDDARVALDSEMRNRSLTPTDLAKQESFEKRSEERESIILKRKLFGSRRSLLDWVRFVLCFLLLFAAAALVALRLPAR